MASHRSLLLLLRGADTGIHPPPAALLGLGAGALCRQPADAVVRSGFGVTPPREVGWLGAASIGGAAAACAAIRGSARLRLPVAWPNTSQILSAIACVIAAYALLGV